MCGGGSMAAPRVMRGTGPTPGRAGRGRATGAAAGGWGRAWLVVRAQAQAQARQLTLSMTWRVIWGVIFRAGRDPTTPRAFLGSLSGPEAPLPAAHKAAGGAGAAAAPGRGAAAQPAPQFEPLLLAQGDLPLGQPAPNFGGGSARSAYSETGAEGGPGPDVATPDSAAAGAGLGAGIAAGSLGSAGQARKARKQQRAAVQHVDQASAPKAPSACRCACARG
jgi:hypothetical protein